MENVLFNQGKYRFKNKTLESLYNSKQGVNWPKIRTALQFLDQNPEYDYTNFKNNLSKTTFYNRPSDIDENNPAAYITEANFISQEISLIKTKSEIASEYLEFVCLYHEYYHIASTSLKNNGYGAIGFYQKLQHETLGYGLNEGVTQYFVYKDLGLSDYYIPVENDGKSSGIIAAPMETSLAALLTHVVEEDSLKKMYLDGNIRALIEELSLYKSKKEVVEWISDIDSLSITKDINTYNKCYNFISDMFLSKKPSSTEIIGFIKDSKKTQKTFSNQPQKPKVKTI